MKKTPLRKVSNIGYYQRKCDALMQEVGKQINPKSLISGSKTEVHHHFIPKSVCSALRYDWDNLIPLTNAEHCRLHQSPDPTIEMQIREKKGKEWWAKLQKKRYTSIRVNKGYYLKVYEELSKKLSPTISLD